MSDFQRQVDVEAERIERVMELGKQLDETDDNDEALSLIERISKESAGLGTLEGYGLLQLQALRVHDQGEYLLYVACLDEEQARRIQTALLLRGVVVAVERGMWPVTEFAHPEVNVTKLAQRLTEEDC